MTDNGPTVIDLLENALGGELDAKVLANWGQQEFDDFADQASRFYDDVSIPALTEGTFRIYSGGISSGFLKHGGESQYLYRSLLYAHAVVIHDPVADWFFKGRRAFTPLPPIRGQRLNVMSDDPAQWHDDGYYAHRDEPERTRELFKIWLPHLATLAPLIREGVVLPVGALRMFVREQNSLAAATRRDVRSNEFLDAVKAAEELGYLPKNDVYRGLSISHPSFRTELDQRRYIGQNVAHYMRRTHLLAKEASAYFVPPEAADEALHHFLLSETTRPLRRVGLELKVVPALVSADLPFMDGIDTRTVISARDNEESFDDWRRTLRQAMRQAQNTDNKDELGEALEDLLLPMATKSDTP